MKMLIVQKKPKQTKKKRWQTLLLSPKDKSSCRRLSTVFLIVLQPQMELLELGTEKGVHILHAEGGGSVFGEAPSSCPGR